MTRGRPRGFDVDQALTTAEALFHEKGYDAVGVAALTEAIGINPPSFYVAFGSKAALFERVMDRYVAEGLRLDAFVSPETTPAEAIRAYLRAAARLYAACPRAPGCLVFEAARGAEGASSTSAARQRKQACWARIEAYVVQTHSATAAIVADVVVTILSGMSAGAREGWDEARLLDVATTASAGIADALASGRSSEPHQIKRSCDDASNRG